MKTKFILTAMCLPLAFAACTNEDVLVKNQNALEGKKVVDFKVSATYGADGAESRMVNNNGTFLWEGTDVLGAAWNLGGSIYSNNKFVNTLTEASATADFTTQATTVVGDYVFYYPYNTDVTKDLNSGIVYSLPEPQEYDPTGEKMMNNNFMISPNIKVDGNEPGELTLPLTMRSIYAYGQLNLKLSEGIIVGGSTVSSVNIQKIIINYTASNVAKDGSIDVTALPVVDLSEEHIANLIKADDNTDYDVNLTAAEEEALEGKTEAEVRAAIFAAADKALTDQTVDYLDATVDNLTVGTGIEQVSIACVSEENPNGINLNLNSTFSTRVLLPTADLTTVTVTVYTDKGKWESTPATNQKIKRNHTANLANLNRVANGKTALLINGLAIDNNINAISEADFIAAVKAVSTGTVNVTVGDFSLTPAAVAAIPAGVTLNFTSAATFEGDMTLKNMTFTTVNLKSGKIELAEGINAGILNVDGAEAKITALGSYTAINVNSGSLEIAAVNANGEAVALAASSVSVGSVVDGNPVAASLKVTNNLTAAVTVKAEGSLENAATISSLTVEENAAVTNGGKIASLTANAGEITNNGIISTGANAGYILNNEGGKIFGMNNSGKIELSAGSDLVATHNNEYAEIVYVNGSRLDVPADEDGEITFVADAFATGLLLNLDDCVTKVLFTSDVTISADETLVADKPAALKTIEFKGNLTVASDKTLTLFNETTLLFTAEKQTVSGTIAGGTNGVKIEVGVKEDPATEEIEEVATDLTITNVSSITNVIDVTVNANDAIIWNQGTVKTKSGASFTQPAQWTKNAIVVLP